MRAETKLVFAVILAAFSIASAEEEVRIDARLDKGRAAVGEPITLIVIARHAEPLSWETRSVADRLGPFDVEQASGPEDLPADPNGGPGRATRWIFRLAAFEFGRLEIPSFPLRYAPPGSAEPRSVPTPALKVEIVPTVQDPNTQMADIRGGFTLPRDLTGWIWGISLATAALLAGIFTWRALRRRRGGAAVPAGPPPRPAYERYMEALERLLRSGLLESGRVKEFHVEIAEIVKRYLGEVYDFDAVDRTTWEVLVDLDAAGAPAAVRAEAGAFLGACDLVKFAKHVPGDLEQRETIVRSRRILELARPAVAPASAPAASVALATGGSP